MMLYPIAISLTMLSVFGRFFRYNHTIIVSVMTMSVISAFFDFIKALPAEWVHAIAADGIITICDSYLPFFTYGFGWVVPTLAGFLIGAVVVRIRSSVRA